MGRGYAAKSRLLQKLKSELQLAHLMAHIKILF